MSVVLVVGFATLALIVGSFLNVVIYRVPRGESVVSPRSRCPQCEAQIRERDNIPVVSWLLLRGKCRDCGAPVSIRYPLVELSHCALWLIFLGVFGWSIELPAYLYLGTVGLALGLIDLDTKRLPNALTLPSYLVAGVLLLLPAIVDSRWDDYLRAALGGMALYAFYFLLLLIYPKGMGFGDVKLAGVLGIYLGFLGWGVLVVGGFLGFLLGGLLGAALMVIGRAGRKSKIPFGPYMLIGALLAIVWGQQMWDKYVSTLT